MPLKSGESSLAKWTEELKKDIARWNDIYINGCSDPFWPDGTNLNLKRNHIIYDLRQIMELQTGPLQVSLFDDPGVGAVTDVTNDDRIPPKVPDTFMAKPRVCRYFDCWGNRQEDANENHAG